MTRTSTSKTRKRRSQTHGFRGKNYVPSQDRILYGLKAKTNLETGFSYGNVREFKYRGRSILFCQVGKGDRAYGMVFGWKTGNKFKTPERTEGVPVRVLTRQERDLVRDKISKLVRGVIYFW